MLKKLIKMIKEAIASMVGYKNVTDTISETNAISDRMKNAIDLWENMYKDQAPWINHEQGVVSQGLAKEVCQSVAIDMLTEAESKVELPGAKSTVESHADAPESEEKDPSDRAGWLNKFYKDNLLKKLQEQLEKGLALGGMIIKPYVSNDNVYFDFCRQGSFVPMSFDYDGNIVDVAFVEQFTSGNNVYTRIERQTFANNAVSIENKAYVSKNVVNGINDLGKEIDLASVEKWKHIMPTTTIEGVDKPLFGYYRVASANNIDLVSPLGMSIFSPAAGVIELADMQLSRLDWEYEGGQMAIDVDQTALYPQGEPKFADIQSVSNSRMGRLRERIYRKLDFGDETTYKEFAPTLRDANYINGLNYYRRLIEGLCNIARGTLSDVEADARTAEEIRTTKKKTYNTISRNQEALGNALKDAVKAADALCDAYEIAGQGEYVLSISWGDSILTDTSTELKDKMELAGEDILSKAEVRSWYTGEDLETAKGKIEEIAAGKENALLSDIFAQQKEDQGSGDNEQ